VQGAGGRLKGDQKLKEPRAHLGEAARCDPQPRAVIARDLK
jgi:hypothetical protein